MHGFGGMALWRAGGKSRPVSLRHPPTVRDRHPLSDHMRINLHVRKVLRLTSGKRIICNTKTSLNIDER